MAEAMKYVTVIAGRLGYKAGRIPKNLLQQQVHQLMGFNFNEFKEIFDFSIISLKNSLTKSLKL